MVHCWGEEKRLKWVEVWESGVRKGCRGKVGYPGETKLWVWVLFRDQISDNLKKGLKWSSIYNWQMVIFTDVRLCFLLQFRPT